MQGKIIAVTGAAGALGKVVAQRLADAGAHVIGIDLVAFSPAGGVAEALGEVDLRKPEAVKGAVDTIRNKHGRLDGLVNVAGGFAWETIAEGSIDTWDRLYDMNVRSALLASQAMLPLLTQAGGAIVNISANGSVRADTGMGAYAASKSGVSRLTEALAAELKDKGVRVNAILPSIIDTPANRKDMPGEDFDRWVSPDALADVIAFLLSDAARAVTGALLPVLGRV